MKKMMKWLHAHSLVNHIFTLVLIIVVAWVLGQLFGPALMKTIFL